jgi:CRISPR system Cascade subunit CasA
VELGLRDVLVHAYDQRELDGDSPLVTVALHRLLLAVLHRVFGPPGYGEWAALWDAGSFDAGRLDAYLEQWRARFDLFDDECPFYQAADDRVEPKPLNRLIHEVAHGNNPTLFDHHTHSDAPVLTPAQSARALATVQSFGVGGLSGLPQKYTDAPCGGSIMFLVQGETLFETLALNLLPYPDEATFAHSPEDRPAWEMEDPFMPPVGRPSGYLDYLTWQNRRILLMPSARENGVVVTQMTEAPARAMGGGILNPMAHYRRDAKRGPVPLLFREGRALWRDSAALFRLGEAGFRPPEAFRWLAELVDEGVLDEAQTRCYLAMGMSKKQAKVNFFRSERMPLPLEYLRDRELVDALEEALEMAEATRRQLWGVMRTLATYVLSPEADSESGRQPAREDLDALTGGWSVERRYWQHLELPFRRTMEELPRARDGALESWRTTLWRTAWQAFEDVAANLGADPRSLKAVVRARDQLAAGLAKALPAS